MNTTLTYLVFPVDPDAPENLPLHDLLMRDQPKTGADDTHTRNFMTTHTAGESLYELVELPRALPTCRCGCGQRIRGKQKYATTACQVRAWRATHKGGHRPDAHPVLTTCWTCQGWKLGNGEPFQCESCADPDAPYHYSDLLRLSPVPAESVDPQGRVVIREEPPIRYVRIYLGTTHLYSRCVDDTWTEILGGREEPVVCAMIRYLGGEGNRVPTARLIAEAERQFQVRTGHVAMRRATAVTIHSEKDAERHAAVLRDREVWGQHPITPEVMARQGADSREHNERTQLKYGLAYQE
jgi:hypothetical protein